MGSELPLPTPGEAKVRWPVADLRDAPGGAIIAKLQQGARVAVLERKDRWTHVRSVGGKSQGWVNSDSLEGGVPLAATATAAAPKNAVAPAQAAAEARVRPARANLRDAPNGKVIAKLLRGTKLAIAREDGEWLEVSGGGKKGWISIKVVDRVAAATPGPAAPPAAASAASAGSGTVGWDTVNLRDAPDGKKIGEIAKGTKLTIIRQEGGFLNISAEGDKSGWVAAGAVIRDTAARPAPASAPAPAPASAVAASPGQTAKVAWEKVNLRATARTGKVLATLRQGTSLVLLPNGTPESEGGKWLHVRAGKLEGWIAGNAVSLNEPAKAAASAPAPEAPPALPPGDISVRWTNVNMRALPTKASESILKLPKGTKLRRLGTDKGWTKVQTVDNQQIGWVDSRSITAAP
jgi:uncharacterized protein YgiM (DUF1202 family)